MQTLRVVQRPAGLLQRETGRMAAALEIRESPQVLVALAKTGTASTPLRNERRRIIIITESSKVSGFAGRLWPMAQPERCVLRGSDASQMAPLALPCGEP